MMNKAYQGKIWVFDLLSLVKPGEPDLSDGWVKCIRKNNLSEDIPYLHVDFHGVTKGNDFLAVNKYIEKYNKTQNDCGYNVFKITLPTHDEKPKITILNSQKGVFRTNCVDCLDRTNAWKTKLGFLACKSMLSILNIQKELVDTPLNHIDKGNIFK